MTPTLWVVVGALVLLSATLYVAGRKSEKGPGFFTLARFAFDRHPWQVTIVGAFLIGIAIRLAASLLSR